MRDEAREVRVRRDRRDRRRRVELGRLERHQLGSARVRGRRADERMHLDGVERRADEVGPGGAQYGVQKDVVSG